MRAAYDNDTSGAGGITTLEAALCYVARQYGAGALNNASRTCSTVADIVPTLKKERNLLDMLYRCGGGSALFGVKDAPDEKRKAEIARLSLRMSDELGASEEGAYLVCASFLNALTPGRRLELSPQKAGGYGARRETAIPQERADRRAPDTVRSQPAAAQTPASTSASDGARGLKAKPILIAAAAFAAVYFIFNISPKKDMTELELRETAEPLATAAPTPEELTADWYYGDPSQQMSRVPITDVYASSELLYEGNIFYAGDAIDGSLYTSWQEADAGDGSGQYLFLDFGTETYVDAIRIFPSYGNPELPVGYENNNRVKQARFRFSDGSSVAFTFPDSKEFFCIELSHSVATTSLQITIESVYPGVKYNDSVITEVEVYSK